MKIEYLFKEYCNLFGDLANVKYLMQCLPQAELIETHLGEKPAFAAQKVDLIYMGGMTEKCQLQVIQKLMPYKARLKELIEGGTVFLMTSNAIEIFGQWIEDEKGRKAEALGIFDFYAKQDMMHRFNCLVLGEFQDMQIVGFKTQFTMAYAKEWQYPFMTVKKGIGMNPAVDQEGIHYHNFYATYLVGPFLILNPLFTKYLLQKMGVSHAVLVYEPVITAAYKQRLSEFQNARTRFF